MHIHSTFIYTLLKRFNMCSDKERKLLSSSLGNLLPLSKRINSKLQNYSFEVKKDRYAQGSKSEIDVSRCDEWNPQIILQRGLDILSFMEIEWVFRFPNLESKKKILGLDFMLEENDKDIDVNVTTYSEEQKSQKELIYNEEQFNKLVAHTNQSLIDKYNELDKYIMSLNPDIKRITTTVYLSYYYNKNFIEIWFQVNGLKCFIMAGDYNDPKQKVFKIAESYNWTIIIVF